MGEVYKAKDTRLDRTVAIKVLPSHLSDNAPPSFLDEKQPRSPRITTKADEDARDE